MSLIVLTGAHGFIGNNLLEKLLKVTNEELGLKKNSNLQFSNFQSIPNDSLSFIITDLPTSMGSLNARRFAGLARVTYVDYENLFEYLDQLNSTPLAVIHNGACSSTTETNPEVFFKLNLNYSKMVWDYCTRKEVPLLYASSAATYGNGELGFSDKKEEDCEKYTPLNLYGKSKLDFDIWTLKQTKTPPTWFGLRYFNVYGQFESHKGGQASMVYHGYQQATRTGQINLFKSNTPLYTDGNQERDFIYIDDIVNITLLLLRVCFERKKGSSQRQILDNGLFLNLGTGVPQTWNHLAENVFDALNMKTNIQYIPMPQNIAGQYQNYTCANLTSLRHLGIDYTFTSLKEGVKKYVQKHLVRGQ